MTLQPPPFFPLEGGLNLSTPAIRTPSGHAIAANNYQPIERGYGREDGYERFDGQPKPSKASYWILPFDTGTAAVVGGDTVTGATSAATGKALIAGVVESGSYAGGDAAGYVVLTNVSGVFQDNEDLQVSAATRCVANGEATERAAATDALDATYLRDAIETARALIAAPTGSGPIRGVWSFGGNKYCFRDNVGATAGQMFRSTASGWQLVTLGREIAFISGGVAEIAEGDTITGAISGATATVERVNRTGGTWGNGDVVGWLTLSGQTGTFQVEHLNTATQADIATIAGDSADITLPPGGRYEFRNDNFFGASNLRRMYGVNGVGPAFEFDGTVFANIRTAMAADTPNHLEAFKNHLFLAFPGGSLQNSATGNPHVWSVVTGSAEIGLGTDVTGLLDVVEGTMVVGGRNRIAVLYGDDSNNFALRRFSSDSGVIEWTLDLVGTPLYMDDRGVRSLSATERFGNFRMGSVTDLVQPFIKKKRANGVTVRACVRLRERDQYKVFFSDKSGLTVYFGRGRPEILPFTYSHQVECIASADEADGSEVVLFGDADGMVYELNAGTSFDGGAIEAFLRLAFNHLGSPAYLKCFQKATLEVDAAGPTSLSMTAEFSYADPDQPSATSVTFEVDGGGAFWDEGALWDNFFWSASTEGVAEAHINGLGTNIGIAILHTSTYEPAHTLHGLTLNYSLRGMVR